MLRYNQGTPSLREDVYDAIEESKASGVILHLPWSQAAEEILYAECDDRVENGNIVEFWGDDLDGVGWRVHLEKGGSDA